MGGAALLAAGHARAQQPPDPSQPAWGAELEPKPDDEADDKVGDEADDKVDEERAPSADDAPPAQQGPQVPWVPGLRMEPCPDPEECQKAGRCWTYGGDCRAFSPADCRQSEACREGDDCFYVEESGRCEESTVRKNKALFVTGIIALGAGGVAILLGGVFQALTSSFSSRDEVNPLSLGLFVGGAIGMAYGVPATAFGAQKEKRQRDARRHLPELRIGAGSASLSWSF